MIFRSSIVQGRQFLAILFFLFLFSLVFISPLHTQDLPKDFSDSIVQTILCLRNPSSKLSASHINHPGYEDIAFLYDKDVDALILKSAGYQKHHTPTPAARRDTTSLHLPAKCEAPAGAAFPCQSR